MNWISWLRGLPSTRITDETISQDLTLSDPNDHVRDYLNYYLGLTRSPNYAVLLSGVWGSGKTFQARRIIGGIAGQDAYVFISLNGISSRRELDDAVFAGVYPWTKNRGVRVGTAVGKALLKHAKIDLPDLERAELTARSAAEAYIFDDLERCLLPLSETLGYINEFVERDGRKVVIIADETKVRKDEKYDEIKEKVIGKTLAISPDFEGAIHHFENLLESPGARALLQRFRPEIEGVYHQSELQNLRILQQTMSDFSRVFAALEDKHIQHTVAMRSLVRLFFALSFELRAGRITGRDLWDRMDKIVAGMIDDKNPTPLSAADSRYSGFELSDSILPDDELFEILVNGRVNHENIRKSIDASPWFLQGDEPTWRSVWHSFERDDASAAESAEQLRSEFESRTYDRSGEVLHLFGLMLWLSHLGVSSWDRGKTVHECKSYVDDLRKQNRLEGILRTSDGVSFGSYGGLGFHERDTDEFKELATYLREQRAAAEADKYPDEAAKLAQLATQDVTEFTREIAFVRDAKATFARVPIFQFLDPGTFANELLTVHPLTFREVMMAFNLRYDGGSLARDLSAERPWAQKLHDELQSQAGKLNPFGRDRVRAMAGHSIGKPLSDLKDAEQQQVPKPA